jgi:hypothetical protein
LLASWQDQYFYYIDHQCIMHSSKRENKNKFRSLDNIQLKHLNTLSFSL